MFSRLIHFIRQVIGKLFPYRSIESAESIESPLSSDMINALNNWHDMYTGRAPWLGGESDIKSLNLPVLICSEIARQITLELKWNITSGQKNEKSGDTIENDRSKYLKAEFEKLMTELRAKVEQAGAAGGMVIKPYPKDGHLLFDYVNAWNMYPVQFDNDGSLKDVIFLDTFQDGKTTYTRIERHQLVKQSMPQNAGYTAPQKPVEPKPLGRPMGEIVPPPEEAEEQEPDEVQGATRGQDDAEEYVIRITQRAFKSNSRSDIGVEISLTDVPQWANLKPEVIVRNFDGHLFGWYKVASANHIDVDSPMGVSFFSRAVDAIKQADIQYSRLLWEYEGGELAIDVDPSVLQPKPETYIDPETGKSKTRLEMPKLNNRLFRKVDLNKDEEYNVFNPAFRDESLIRGLNQLLMRVEDLCGISRGTISDANVEARTATELNIIRNRTYATISDNQKALERCLRDVVRVMDKYASLYGLAPEGDYDVSFDWDDSIVNDTAQQLDERLRLLSLGIIGKVEMREWYFGETKAQAQAAIAANVDETVGIEALLNPMRELENPAETSDDKKKPPNNGK